MAKKAKSKSKRTVKAKAPDDSSPQQVNVGNRFKPGQSGNPAGRPKGSRVKFGEDFVEYLAAHWKEHRKETLDWLFARKKEAYAKVVVAVLPKVIDISAEVEHRVYERIPWDDIIKRAEQYPEPKPTRH